jgi:hypothetical protein
VFQRINKSIDVALYHLRVGSTKVFSWSVGERNYLVWMSRPESSSIVDRIGTKDMCSVSVSHSMVLTFSLSSPTLEIWCVALSWTETACCKTGTE